MVDDPGEHEEGDAATSPIGDARVAPTERIGERLVPGVPSAGPVALPALGYQLGEEIGRGGMGEVIAAFDQRIGRGVAIKRMRSACPSEEETARFLREARIQARLDHPAIVPVHELGVDEAGRPYFTMKRLAGHTLGDRMADGAPQPQLLRAFADVCLAVEFAHARGVVHRDLKPANIMLGDYGEVYVLDWGVARVLAEPVSAGPVNAGPASADPGLAARPSYFDSIETLDDTTKTGALLGTPGYSAPEQLRGDPVAAAADVYALGAILFELLAGEPLHPRGQTKAIASTLASPQELPSRRRPDLAIPPELDEACAAALAEDPAERPTAHELARRVQAYLDGDRDLERRRALAVRQLRSAREALASSEPDRHATGLRRAARALALDPESREAGALVGALLLEPPDPRSSPALAASLDEHDRQLSRYRSRQAIYAYLMVFVLLPFTFLLDIRNWGVVAAAYATVLAGIVTSWRHLRAGQPSVPVALAISFTLAMLFTRIASPLILAPVMICGALAVLTAVPAIAARLWLVLAWTVVTVMAPFVAEWIGLIPATWEIAGRHLTITADLIGGHGRDEEIALVISNVLSILVFAWLAFTISRRRLAAQRQLHIQAWHLGQLVPDPGAGGPGARYSRLRTGHL